MPAMGPTSVRRNLFHQNLSRRPASTGPPNGNVPPGNNALSNRPSHSHRLKPTGSDSSSRPIKLSENKEIVVRDQNGGYKLDVPALPNALVGEDGEELGELEAEECGETALDSSELSGREKEKLEAALVEMVIRHRNRPSSSEPDEILNIVHQSLRRKVASLDDDKWMFEPEKEVRF
ncbi:uncharacterized protein N7482_005265 [Penicillium canariense]|uniref:Uncharacterized protein n=1 Tax=Penicillium canariense TaxID=189055 RepID=A0A9W9I230_9EURO|nr:uncharacterized protein N7482_005265 [Penicillium canariense]KAJ5166484.1 hypothetical protein N7482_005265 [Penicillium canariense]